MRQIPYTIIFAVVAAFAVATIVVRVAHAVVQRLLDTIAIVSPANRAALHIRARHLKRAVTLLAYTVAAVASLSLAVAQLGLGRPGWDLELLGRWVLNHGVNLVVIVVGGYVVVRAANFVVEHLQARLGQLHAPDDFEYQRRAATLGGMASNLVTAMVVFAATLMLLRELSIDVLPILTGAGIAGLAVGFGGQNLVRDVIAGFFLILEDQVRVGDTARINGITGTVDQIKLRTILLRDGDGALFVFPNGSVTTLANLSREYLYAVVDVRVAYTENVTRVFGTISAVGSAMERDATWGGLLLAPVEVLGIESLADGLATVRVRCKTAPFNQGKVANELRARLMSGFVRSGIRPFAS
jgi:small-conductance mechanosensitive channel